MERDDVNGDAAFHCSSLVKGVSGFHLSTQSICRISLCSGDVYDRRFFFFNRYRLAPFLHLYPILLLPKQRAERSQSRMRERDNKYGTRERDIEGVRKEREG
jgi:hypothetical protein